MPVPTIPPTTIASICGRPNTRRSSCSPDGLGSSVVDLLVAEMADAPSNLIQPVQRNAPAFSLSCWAGTRKAPRDMHGRQDVGFVNVRKWGKQFRAPKG